MKLSKKALEMLEYNGYSLKEHNDQITVSHSSFDSIGLIVILFLSLVGIVFLTAIEPWFGIGALVIAVLIFLPIIKRNKGSFKLTADKGKSRFEISGYNHAISFSKITGIFIHSKFVDEYSSAFKSTSEEHRVTIGLVAQNEQVPVFKLIADHAKPSKEMNEVYTFLEGIIQGGKSQQ
ncbi:hypothetical protein [Ekhidna sp.]|uniref:hypothetical protein n=1 Tax=Ekhidna sp. TaxID=2608089 RepID=UPI003297AF6C